MKIFSYVPEICLSSGEEIATSVRKQLVSALARSFIPVGLPGAVKKITIELDATQLAQVNVLGDLHRMAPGKVIGGLLYAQHLAGKSKIKAASGSSLVDSPPTPVIAGLRSGQERALIEIVPLLASGRIVLAECGTGSGKSRLIAHVAEFIVQMRRAKVNPKLVVNLHGNGTSAAGDTPRTAFLQKNIDAVHAKLAKLPSTGPTMPILVVAPSVDNIAHLLDEWTKVLPVIDPEGLLRITTILGRSQFVSPSAVLDLLDIYDSERIEIYAGAEKVQYDKDRLAITAWLDAGMPCGLTPASRKLGTATPRLRGLMVDLRTLIMPLGDLIMLEQDVALSEHSSTDERMVYDAMRDLENASRCDVIFTTHAMLCLDNLLLAREGRAPLLPPACAVLIDEAHLLESSQASMASKAMSLHRLRALMSESTWLNHPLAKTAAEIRVLATAANNMLRNIPSGTALPVPPDAQPGDTAEDARIRSVWESATVTLATLWTKLDSFKLKAPRKTKSGAPSKAKDPAAGLTPQMKSSIRYAEQCVEALAYLDKQFNGHIEQSPVRNSVSFLLGPKSVSRYLLARWAISPCALLVSGTLLHYAEGGPQEAPMARELEIPKDRASMITPLHPAWLTGTPTVHIPQISDFHLLMPPIRKNHTQSTEQAWFDNVAIAMHYVATKAKGGTLVLCSGYDRAKGMATAFMAAHPQMSSRVILQERTVRVGPCRDSFIAMHAAGVKPIWFACGGAWTGLDMKDETIGDASADEDTLLTDLVIPALPFGMENNTTAIARKERLGFYSEIVSTQRRFRQGIGRLVRREGLLHRNIWLLDGRLQHPDTQYTKEIRHWLGRFMKRKTFSL